MTLLPTAWIKAGAALVAALIFAAFMLGRCSAPDPAPLPPKVQHDLDRHLAQKAADSATIVLLEADTLAKHHQIQALADSAAVMDTAARISGDRADSSAARAAGATTARDSARYWHAAYVDRTHEADTFQRELLLVTSKALLLGQQKTTVSTIGGLYKSEAQLGDVIIQELKPLAEEPDRCRILWAFHCPTRKEAFGGGVVVAIASYGAYRLVDGIVKGKIRIPVALSF